MKFNVEVEIDDLEEEFLDKRFKEELKQAIISQYVKNFRFEDSKFYNDFKANIIEEAKKYIHQKVDGALENVVTMIARKKAILELTPEQLKIDEFIDKVLARRFSK